MKSKGTYSVLKESEHENDNVKGYHLDNAKGYHLGGKNVI